mmetsp:Transcript_4194/g.10709  ORF Transcript_4194/g.10709 Transcript_4194/m.10709 type:complete len:351 (-) Transcript_4194:1194-2246(-)
MLRVTRPRAHRQSTMPGSGALWAEPKPPSPPNRCPQQQQRYNNRILDKRMMKATLACPTYCDLAPVPRPLPRGALERVGAPPPSRELHGHLGALLVKLRGDPALHLALHERHDGHLDPPQKVSEGGLARVERRRPLCARPVGVPPVPCDEVEHAVLHIIVKEHVAVGPPLNHRVLDQAGAAHLAVKRLDVLGHLGRRDDLVVLRNDDHRGDALVVHVLCPHDVAVPPKVTPESVVEEELRPHEVRDLSVGRVPVEEVVEGALQVEHDDDGVDEDDRSHALGRVLHHPRQHDAAVRVPDEGCAVEAPLVEHAAHRSNLLVDAGYPRVDLHGHEGKLHAEDGAVIVDELAHK